MQTPPIVPGRKVDAISAVYLPWRPVARIDWDSFEMLVRRTWDCGLTPAINMDTGFVNLLSQQDRHAILEKVAAWSEGRRWVGGAFVEGMEGDVLSLYRREMEQIEQAGGTPIVFQCSQLTSRTDSEIYRVYESLAKNCQQFLAFELGTMFVPFGKIYSLTLFSDLLDIGAIRGIKHSSLSRIAEWERLEIRNAKRPSFAIYTGNDLAIDMIQWGSDYLLGLSAFYPEAFALRDQYWKECDARFYPLNDLLQFLGTFCFRSPVPGYKHNCAMFLALRNGIASDAQPIGATSRPSEDRELLHSILNDLEEWVS